MATYQWQFSDSCFGCVSLVSLHVLHLHTPSFTHLISQPSLYSPCKPTCLQYLLFLLLLSPPSLALSEPSLIISSAASSQLVHMPHLLNAAGQDQPSIANPFIAASSQTGRLRFPSSFPHEREAPPAFSKEDPPLLASPASIYESEPTPTRGSHLHNNLPLQEGDKSPGNMAASTTLPAKAHHHETTLLMHKSAPQEDDPLFSDCEPSKEQKEAEPLLVYDAVVVARFSSEPSLLHNNVPQEKNAFLLDDGKTNPIMQNKEDLTTFKPSFKHELAASATQYPEDHDSVSNNAAQEEIGKHVDSVVTEPKPIIGKQLTFEYVATSVHPQVIVAIPDYVPQKEKDFLLYDGGKHAGNVKEETNAISTGKPFKYESVLARSYTGAHDTGRGSGLGDNVSEEESSSLVDVDGSKWPKHVVHDSRAAAVANSVQEDKLLQDNVPQETYAFLHGDGRKKPISSTLDNANYKNWLIDTGPKEGKSYESLHDTGVRNQMYGSPVDVDKRKKVHSNKTLKDKDANINNHKKLPIYHKLQLGKGSFTSEENPSLVVGDSSRSMQMKKKQQATSKGKHDNCDEGNLQTVVEDPQKEDLRMVVGDGPDNLIQKGAVGWDTEASYPNAENPRPDIDDSSDENVTIVEVGDSLNKMVHGGDGINQLNEENQGMYKGFESEDHPANHEENLKMVVDDYSSNNMIQRGHKVEGSPSSEGNLRMVGGDSYKSMVQEGYGNSPATENNLRTVVDDAQIRLTKGRPLHGTRHGRSRSCTSNPDVCHQLTHGAEHIQHIALYGQPSRPTPQKKWACCSGVCVDLNDNQLNCGGCGRACGLSKTCCSGKCTDLNTNDLNCGKCGVTCDSFSPCQYGLCGYYN